MSINSETTFSGPFICNGVTLTFGYGFTIFDADEIEFVMFDPDTGALTVASPAGYSVTDVGVDGGGDVVFTVAPGTALAPSTGYVRRKSEFKQIVTDGAPLFAATVVRMADRAVMYALELREEAHRSIRLSIGETCNPLPPAAHRAGKILSFDDDGLIDISIDRVDVTAVAAKLTEITTLSGLATEIGALGAMAADIATVADLAADIETVAGYGDELTTIAAAIELIDAGAAQAPATHAANAFARWNGVANSKTLIERTAAEMRTDLGLAAASTVDFARVRLPDGTAAAPSLKVGDEENGLLSPAANQLAVTLNGTQRANFSTTALASGALSFQPGDGTLSVPGWGFNSQTNTGRRRAGASDMRDVVNGADVVQYTTAGQFDASGNIWQVGGKHMIPLPASAWVAQTTNGPGWYSTELATHKHMIQGWAFDQTTAEYVQLRMPMPKSWNEGTFTARIRWTAPTGAGNVVWAVQALAVGDDDALDAAWGTAVTVTDGLTATGDLMVSAETGAITAAGSPSEIDTLVLRVYRDAANGSDTFSADAVLLSVEIFPVINGANDA